MGEPNSHTTFGAHTALSKTPCASCSESMNPPAPSRSSAAICTQCFPCPEGGGTATPRNRAPFRLTSSRAEVTSLLAQKPRSACPRSGQAWAWGWGAGGLRALAHGHLVEDHFPHALFGGRWRRGCSGLGRWSRPRSGPGNQRSSRVGEETGLRWGLTLAPFGEKRAAQPEPEPELEPEPEPEPELIGFAGRAARPRNRHLPARHPDGTALAA